MILIYMMVLCTQVNKMYVNCYSECISTPGKREKYAWPRWDSNLRPLECEPNALPTELRGQVGSSI